MRIRDDAAVQVWSSIFTDFADGAIRIDNDAAQDSYKRLVDGDIAFKTNLFHNFGDGTTMADIAIIKDGDGADVVASDAMVLQNALADSKVEDPQLAGIARTSDGGLDPRPNDGSPALTDAELPADPFFDVVNFKGAFSNRRNWAENWTALSEYGFFGDLVTLDIVEVGENKDGVKLGLPAPNPIRYQSTVNFELPDASDITVQVYDIAGRLVKEQGYGYLPKGEHQFQIDARDYETGIYVMALITEMGVIVQKIAVSK